MFGVEMTLLMSPRTDTGNDLRICVERYRGIKKRSFLAKTRHHITHQYIFHHFHHILSAHYRSFYPSIIILSITMFSKIAALNLLVLSASATALPAESQLYKWAVHGFASTCTAATCRYTFNVSGSTGPSNQPAFDASCYGNSVQGGFKSCAIVGIDAPGDVQTQEENFGTDIGAVISVQYTFEQ